MKKKIFSDEAKKNLVIYGGVFIGIPFWIFVSGELTLSEIKILGIVGLLMLIIPLGYVFAFIFHLLILIQLAINGKVKNRFSGIVEFLIAYMPFVILLVLLFLFEPDLVDLISF